MRKRSLLILVLGLVLAAVVGIFVYRYGSFSPQASSGLLTLDLWYITNPNTNGESYNGIWEKSATNKIQSVGIKLPRQCTIPNGESSCTRTEGNVLITCSDMGEKIGCAEETTQAGVKLTPTPQSLCRNNNTTHTCEKPNPTYFGGRVICYNFPGGFFQTCSATWPNGIIAPSASPGTPNPGSSIKPTVNPSKSPGISPSPALAVFKVTIIDEEGKLVPYKVGSGDCTNMDGAVSYPDRFECQFNRPEKVDKNRTSTVTIKPEQAGLKLDPPSQSVKIVSGITPITFKTTKIDSSPSPSSSPQVCLFPSKTEPLKQRQSSIKSIFNIPKVTAANNGKIEGVIVYTLPLKSPEYVANVYLANRKTNKRIYFPTVGDDFKVDTSGNQTHISFCLGGLDPQATYDIEVVPTNKRYAPTFAPNIKAGSYKVIGLVPGVPLSGELRYKGKLYTEKEDIGGDITVFVHVPGVRYDVTGISWNYAVKRGRFTTLGDEFVPIFDPRLKLEVEVITTSKKDLKRLNTKVITKPGTGLIINLKP